MREMESNVSLCASHMMYAVTSIHEEPHDASSSALFGYDNFFCYISGSCVYLCSVLESTGTNPIYNVHGTFFFRTVDRGQIFTLLKDGALYDYSAGPSLKEPMPSRSTDILIQPRDSVALIHSDTERILLLSSAGLVALVDLPTASVSGSSPLVNGACFLPLTANDDHDTIWVKSQSKSDGTLIGLSHSHTSLIRFSKGEPVGLSFYTCDASVVPAAAIDKSWSESLICYRLTKDRYILFSTSSITSFGISVEIEISPLGGGLTTRQTHQSLGLLTFTPIVTLATTSLPADSSAGMEEDLAVIFVGAEELCVTARLGGAGPRSGGLEKALSLFNVSLMPFTTGACIACGSLGSSPGVVVEGSRCSTPPSLEVRLLLLRQDCSFETYRLCLTRNARLGNILQCNIQTHGGGRLPAAPPGALLFSFVHQSDGGPHPFHTPRPRLVLLLAAHNPYAPSEAGFYLYDEAEEREGEFIRMTEEGRKPSGPRVEGDRISLLTLALLAGEEYGLVCVYQHSGACVLVTNHRTVQIACVPQPEEVSCISVVEVVQRVGDTSSYTNADSVAAAHSISAAGGGVSMRLLCLVGYLNGTVLTFQQREEAEAEAAAAVAASEEEEEARRSSRGDGLLLCETRWAHAQPVTAFHHDAADLEGCDALFLSVSHPGGTVCTHSTALSRICAASHGSPLTDYEVDASSGLLYLCCDEKVSVWRISSGQLEALADVMAFRCWRLPTTVRQHKCEWSGVALRPYRLCETAHFSFVIDIQQLVAGLHATRTPSKAFHVAFTLLLGSCAARCQAETYHNPGDALLHTMNRIGLCVAPNAGEEKLLHAIRMGAALFDFGCSAASYEPVFDTVKHLHLGLVEHAKIASCTAPECLLLAYFRHFRNFRVSSYTLCRVNFPVLVRELTNRESLERLVELLRQSRASPQPTATRPPSYGSPTSMCAAPDSKANRRSTGAAGAPETITLMDFMGIPVSSAEYFGFFAAMALVWRATFEATAELRQLADLLWSKANNLLQDLSGAGVAAGSVPRRPTSSVAEGGSGGGAKPSERAAAAQEDLLVFFSLGDIFWLDGAAASATTRKDWLEHLLRLASASSSHTIDDASGAGPSTLLHSTAGMDAGGGVEGLALAALERIASSDVYCFHEHYLTWIYRERSGWRTLAVQLQERLLRRYGWECYQAPYPLLKSIAALFRAVGNAPKVEQSALMDQAVELSSIAAAQLPNASFHRGTQSIAVGMRDGCVSVLHTRTTATSSFVAHKAPVLSVASCPFSTTLEIATVSERMTHIYVWRGRPSGGFFTDLFSSGGGAVKQFDLLHKILLPDLPSKEPTPPASSNNNGHHRSAARPPPHSSCFLRCRLKWVAAGVLVFESPWHGRLEFRLHTIA